MDKKNIKPIFEIASLYAVVVFFVYFVGKYSSYIAYYGFADPSNRSETYKSYAYLIMSISLCFMLLFILYLYKLKLNDIIKFSKFNLGFVIKLLFIQLAMPFILNINSSKDISLIFGCIKFWFEALQGKKIIISQTLFKPQIDLNWFMIAYTIIVGPIIEEIFYKHVIYHKLKTIISVRIAIIITGVLFFYGHIPYYELKISMLSLLSLGLLTTYCYEKTNTVWSSIIIHSAYNAYVTFIPTTKINLRILIYLIFFIATLVMLTIELIKYLKNKKTFNLVQSDSPSQD
ncbi:MULTISPECIES: CPBP family intramembrane glutamic endopeptidase [unclassified Treponema]|uniref:CPBP family intramembrane glutamic endopeptidase n=1 Tax=unclassified Treponema TaxID=2638727 RepID=UPI0020A59BA5|nr:MULTISPECIES: type II CAAX endopeptidase family protein [unclassified Treponema]UTC67613.1 CPBP family intramembrane metalloprotease [Treponema sp. OMZ 789]UTC70341.1 CPBP family intramembrane metalloprotease [Treponema sp. OMZ 790]UTC73055.1 CPBP family intramembrane metalloprotease [Treponema sp. OMZ 791]